MTIDNIFFVWTGSKTKRNKKDKSIKFEYKISQKSISFLDTEVYIKNNKLYTKIYRKPTDRQNFLHYNSEHPKLLKDSIPYSQTLRIKRICSTITDFQYFATELKNKFTDKGCSSNLLDKNISRVKNLDRREILKEKTKTPSTETCIPLTLKSISTKY